MSAVTRLLESSDVQELTALFASNREFLRPWDPVRGDEFFTVAKQGELVRAALDAYEGGTMVPLAILNSDGDLAGRLNISGIVHGAFQSAVLGYWVSETENGAGLASAAVAEAIEYAGQQLGLHRIQAETLLDNVRSQKVLEKNGFIRYGLAPEYLNIAGRWQDHILFQRILEPAQ
ncbi:GNAT family N-acetyltransferase [Arthrobacter alpinus]|uniref:GNAT family N-acetyltransferase n=1 Tax=Arthrobacter alpinus TaxID=656366 RepID=UPI0009F836CC|nr:GNAT family N-acetyltransferase [Arthrobacter alpinus]